MRGYFDVAANDSTFLFSSAKETDEDGVRKLDVYQQNLRRKAPFFDGAAHVEPINASNVYVTHYAGGAAVGLALDL